MILNGGLMGRWLFALLTLYGVSLGAAVYYLNEPYVEFPPARPAENLLYAICEHGSSRLRYPPEYFPRSGSSHLRRCGKAIDRLESWYAACCTGQTTRGNSHCCADQAWKQALTTFCEEEYSTMTAAYYCCAEEGEAMWTCFNSSPLNPDYSPMPGYTAPMQPPEHGFTFNPNYC